MTIKDVRKPRKPLPESFQITVGIHASEGSMQHNDPLAGGTFADDGAVEFAQSEPRTVAEIGSYHEFGLGVPQRSFIRGWFDESQAELTNLVRSQTQLAVTGKITGLQAAERIALKAEASVKRRIRSNIPPPLAASTIKAKGSSTALIDTGQLRAAIRGKVNVSRSE